MRDVTDKRTGELEVGEIKRGRGRPRKADAMSNAERQAAYRARRRAERVRPVDRAVYDPEALQDVAELEDDMAELRAELDATKAELAEAHQTIDELNDELIPLRVAVKRLEEEVTELNQQFIKLDAERAAAVAGELVVRAELAAAKKGAAKAVTRNEKGPSFDTMARLLSMACKGKTHRTVGAIQESDLWQSRIVGDNAVSEQQLYDLQCALRGKYCH